MTNLSLPIKIIIGVAACTFIGALSGLATASSVNDWYLTINKPVFNPPNWIFAPMWTLLYALMGVAAALVWHEGWEKPKVKTALKVFGFQLLLNALWSIIFFGMQLPGLAFIEISILWVAIITTIILFTDIRKTAGYLLVPYLLWVTFATMLNFSIWWLN